MLNVAIIVFAIITAKPFTGIAIVIIRWVIFSIFIYSVVSAFRLARVLSGTGMGIVCLLGTLIPIVGIVILLLLKLKATKVLKRNGVKVGLLGAKVLST